MGAPEQLALSLGLSVAVAALGWVGGRLFERLSADPRLRDRVWAAALMLPALPPLAVGLLLLTPASVREVPVVAAGPPLLVVPGPAEAAAAALPAPAFVFDPVLAAWAVLAIAALLSAGRLAALALRARRLARIVREARAADPAVKAMVESAARDLDIRAPRVGVSTTTSEALLASLGRARLILPVSLTEGADAVTASAVIAHELAHLKRGDHRALWLEEALLALLAINPLMPLLRARRTAAREEACDALALGDAAPEARRAYARSLIEALRDRVGLQASGGLPALTFTGAGRNTAMHRLKAVLNPVPAAGSGARLLAFGLGAVVAVLAGAGSLAVAAERETVVRVQPAPAAAPAPIDEQPRTVDLGAATRTLMNGEPLPEGLPMWAVAPERVEVRTPPAGSGEVDFILPFTGSTPVSVNGRRMPAGFPASGVNPDAVERVQIVDDHVLYTLKPEAEVRRARTDRAAQQSAPRPTIEPLRNALTSEQQARYRDPTARQYQALCASQDPGDDGFCAGVMFAQLGSAPGNGFCPPASLEQGDEAARRAALGALVARGKAEIARGSVRAGDTASSLALAALIRAYPCEGARAEAFRAEVARVQSFVPLTVAVDIEGRPLSVQGDETLRVVLTDENGAVMNTHGTTSSGNGRASGPLDTLGMAIAPEDFPGPAESAQTYTLTGKIRRPGRVLRYVAEPVTIRLAPGARRVDLRPTLSFRPA